MLILAAGAGRRMGQPKAGVPWNGGTLLDQAVRQGRAAGGSVSVVVGAGYPRARFRCRVQPQRWVVNPHWQQGLSTSLRCGLRCVDARAAGVIIMLVDQPAIPDSFFRTLGEQARQRPRQIIAARRADGGWSVPVYWPRSWFGVLRQLRGDQGGRQLLVGQDVVGVACPEAAWDVDTPQAWRALISQTDRQARQPPE